MSPEAPPPEAPSPEAPGPGSPPIRDAATVMLVRDGAAGLEVFMLRRNLASIFAGGAYVFPGGAVEPSDGHADVEAVCAGRTDADASLVLGLAAGGLAFWVAAVRECFEECGVLLGRDRGGRVLSFSDRATAARFDSHRDRLNGGELEMLELCRTEGIVLDVGSMHYFAHWLTPPFAPRRYDTRFFVAAAPEEQVPLHDDREAIAHLWVRPQDALDRNAAGEYELIRPTMESLSALTRFATSSEVIAAAEAMGRVPHAQERMGADGQGVTILLPGDPGWEQASTTSAGGPSNDPVATSAGASRGSVRG